jgi:putative tryptophan/tyrosine transport system substrate-binding protein
MMRRREFITLLGGAAAWPLTARAQQAERTAHIGVFSYLNENDPEAKIYNEAFLKRLAEIGWSQGYNLRIAYRWTGGNTALIRQYAAELAALGLEVVLVAGGSHVGPLQQVTRTLPIVFVQVADAVGGGFVESLARPGGNATGFTNFEFDISGKWLELLKEIVPSVTRAAVLRDSGIAGGPGQFGAIQATAASFGVELRPVDLDRPGEIEHAVTTFGGASKYGLIVTGSPRASLHRDLIVTLAARHKLPAVYYERLFVAAGGLISYGSDFLDQCRRAAGYVDRILQGEKPADLPVQAPTKYELVINMKTAKALGLTVPDTLLARAEEVIE